MTRSLLEYEISERWPSLREVSEETGIPYRTLLGWVRSGRVPARKVFGTRWHMPKESVELIKKGDLYPAIGEVRKPK